ncbi:hypothetical protein ACFVXC_38705 [Streptomyces sp. NPDC058257]|uniref:hypothetical protein n=1 Tax=Streptomyces sp. NPDC058257 TaxID=3346409 RepID=UPI0036E0F0C3
MVDEHSNEALRGETHRDCAENLRDVSDEHRLEELVAGFIATAQANGQTGPGLDARREADLLVAVAVGLGGDVLHERRALDDVRGALGYHLTKLFSPTGPAQP